MTVIKEKLVKTRKRTKCSACLAVWEKGTTFDKTTVTDEGRIWDFNMCPICWQVIKTYNYDEIYEGDLRDREEWSEAKRELTNSGKIERIVELDDKGEHEQIIYREVKQ